jgi:hypothetical protein
MRIELGALWTYATPEERAEIAQNLFAEVRARDQSIVSARLANDDYLPLVAPAEARGKVVMVPPRVARPEGYG